MIKLDPTWLELLQDQFDMPYFQHLKQTLIEEKKKFVIYPPGSKIFAALDECPLDKVKAVIIGQGLCFSVADGVAPPPSLVNIFTELHDDLNIPMPQNGNLEKWARQGVLLLNASLTVRAHQAASHSQIGWQQFTDTIIQRLSERKENLVFLLWGSFAIRKKTLISPHRGHFVLEAPHPSPLSAYRGFFGCKHFSRANAFLKSKGIAEIDWTP